MSGGIFLIQSGGDLVEMKEQPYDTEAVLQELLAKYPNLLAGDQMDGAAPRRWLRSRGRWACRPGGRRPLVPGQPVSRPGRHPHADRGQTQQRHPHPPRGRRPGARLRRQRRRLLARRGDPCPLQEEGCRQRGADPAKEVETLLGPGACEGRKANRKKRRADSLFFGGRMAFCTRNHLEEDGVRCDSPALLSHIFLDFRTNIVRRRRQTAPQLQSALEFTCNYLWN